MSTASDLSDSIDSVIQNLMNQIEMLRITKIVFYYSFISKNFEVIKNKLEDAGFIISIESQFGSCYNIVITYMRNWGK